MSRPTNEDSGVGRNRAGGETTLQELALPWLCPRSSDLLTFCLPIVPLPQIDRENGGTRSRPLVLRSQPKRQ